MGLRTTYPSRKWAISLLRRLQVIIHMLHDDLAEDFARVDVLQADVGIDRGLHVAVSEKLTDELVLTWSMLEDDCACGVPELVHGYA